MSCSRDIKIFQSLLKQHRTWTRRMCSSENTGVTDKGKDNKTKQKKKQTKNKSAEGLSTKDKVFYYETDPLPLFMDKQVQTLLSRMTGFNISKVLSPHYISEYKKPKFVLATDEELKEMHLRALQTAVEQLQMPPSMKIEQGDEDIYSVDEGIVPFVTNKFVFTDITMGVKDRDRIVTVREPDGTLRPANPEEKTRACQMYNPQPGRKVIMPKMFEPEHLENILHEYNYRYILSRACVQFEPNNPDFHRVCHRVYDHIAEKRTFRSLRSTRFFGPMAFYFTWTKNIERLLIDMLQNDLLDDATDLIHLYQILHPEVKVIDNAVSLDRKWNQDALELIENLDLKEKMKQFAIVQDKSYNRTKIEKQLDILKVFCKQYANKPYADELEIAIQDYAENLKANDSEQQQMT